MILPKHPNRNIYAASLPFESHLPKWRPTKIGNFYHVSSRFLMILLPNFADCHCLLAALYPLKGLATKRLNFTQMTAFTASHDLWPPFFFFDVVEGNFGD